jgi:hypothetical protein
MLVFQYAKTPQPTGHPCAFLACYPTIENIKTRICVTTISLVGGYPVLPNSLNNPYVLISASYRSVGGRTVTKPRAQRVWWDRQILMLASQRLCRPDIAPELSG